MIPKETLFKTIEEFRCKLRDLNDAFEKASEEEQGPIAVELFEMMEAWCKLQDLVEFNLLPFIQK